MILHSINFRRQEIREGPQLLSPCIYTSPFPSVFSLIEYSDSNFVSSGTTFWILFWNSQITSTWLPRIVLITHQFRKRTFRSFFSNSYFITLCYLNILYICTIFNLKNFSIGKVYCKIEKSIFIYLYTELFDVLNGMIPALRIINFLRRILLNNSKSSLLIHI